MNESDESIKKIMLNKKLGGDFNVGCIGKDVKNYLKNKRKKLFKEGDAQMMYDYFLIANVNNLNLCTLQFIIIDLWEVVFG